MRKFIVKSLICSLILGGLLYMKNSDNNRVIYFYNIIEDNLFSNSLDVKEVYSYISNKVNSPSIESSITTLIPSE